MERPEALGFLFPKEPGSVRHSMGGGPIRRSHDVTSQAGPEESDRLRLLAACQEFEAIFIQEMLKHMRRTIPESSQSRDSLLYRSLFDEELSRVLSSRGLGLKEMMLELLEKG
ncbi:MAG: rod-binding protein [Thermodesulfobacteriota bacterium]